MQRKLLLLLPFLLLLACDFGSGSIPLLAPSTSTPLPTFTFSPLPPTATLTPSPTSTATLTETFTLTFTVTQTPTFTITETPSHTPDLFPYVFPVQPSNLAGFAKGGHPFPATDIFAPIGTKFVAVTNGTVDAVTYVNTFNPVTNADAGGLSVRILGDDGFHYYGAHLSSITYGIRPGVWVAAGTLLGLVGNTGDARFTDPHVHFEVSIPNSPFTKIDPFPLLTAWRNGEAITPSLPTSTFTLTPTP
ncbi:MAG: M23 family metallopeptidase [Anaerolineales bacterium]